MSKVNFTPLEKPEEKKPKERYMSNYVPRLPKTPKKEVLDGDEIVPWTEDCPEISTLISTSGPKDSKPKITASKFNKQEVQNRLRNQNSTVLNIFSADPKKTQAIIQVTPLNESVEMLPFLRKIEMLEKKVQSLTKERDNAVSISYFLFQKGYSFLKKSKDSYYIDK